MAYCKNCGNMLDSNAKNCPYCGYPQGTQDSSLSLSIIRDAALPQRGATDHSVFFIIWSLVLVICINPIGTPLAAVAAILASRSRCSKAPREAKRFILYSLIFCIAATIIDIVTLITLTPAAVMESISSGTSFTGSRW